MGKDQVLSAEVAVTQGFVCKLKKGDPEFGYLYRIESEFKVLDLEFASLLAVTASFEAIVTSKRAKDDNGQPKDEVRVQFDVVVAMDVTVGWLITVGVDVPLDFHVDPGLGTCAAVALANPLLLVAETLN